MQATPGKHVRLFFSGKCKGTTARISAEVCFWRLKIADAQTFPVLDGFSREQSGSVCVLRRHAFVTMVQPAAHRKRGELDGSTYHPGLHGVDGSVSVQCLMGPRGMIVQLNVFSE